MNLNTRNTLRLRPTTLSRAWELAASGKCWSVYMIDDEGQRWNLVRIVEEGRTPFNMGWPHHFEWVEWND